VIVDTSKRYEVGALFSTRVRRGARTADLMNDPVRVVEVPRQKAVSPKHSKISARVRDLGTCWTLASCLSCLRVSKGEER